MQKLTCRCGEVLRYGMIPCPIEWLMISDQRFDEITVSDVRLDTSEMSNAMARLLRCPSCGRLWVFWSGYDDEPVEYVVAAPRPR